MRTRITPVQAGDAQGCTWEAQYFDHVVSTGALSLQACGEIGRCVDRVFGAIREPSGASERHRACGAIVGAVQSGKTGVMIALAARALDLGFRLVIVLAGLRDDLRSQTALRFVTDLLQRGDEVFPRSARRRFTRPEGVGYHGPMSDACWCPHYGEDVNHDEAFVSTVARRLKGGRSVLAVAKKNLATLNVLRDSVVHASGICGSGAVPILVLDDECDEATVSGTADAPTPERIVEVWDGAEQYVAYVGLTATPAANLLQETESELFPRDFIEVLRTPAADNNSLAFAELDPDRRYTGGNVFYRLLDGHDRSNFLVRCEMSDAEFQGIAGHDAELEAALISYFVSGAIRLACQPDRSLTDPSRLPMPHTMLAHTESRMHGHWGLCERVVSITRSRGGRDGLVLENIRRQDPAQRLSSGDLGNWLASEPERWHTWYEAFGDSRRTLLEISPDRARNAFPSWEEVREALPEVFDNTKLRVINSDETAADAPLSFKSSHTDRGRMSPTDLYSIVIGGNRLSRGLTIEGLCVSYYTRTSTSFAEDTTVQRERWFGYRGGHLEYCRLFTHRDMAIRLSRFHEHEEDLRLQLAWNLENGRPPNDATFRFLKLRDSRPTAKLGRGREGSLEISGARLFFDRLQMGESPEERAAAERNQEHAAAWSSRLLQDGEALRNRSGDAIGYVIRGISAIDLSAFLEAFQFTFHDPDPSAGMQVNLREWYRPQSAHARRSDAGLSPPNDPYLAAAYLRFWDSANRLCEADPPRNRFRDRDAISTWRPCPPPTFNVAVRFGSLPPAAGSPFEHDLLNRAVSANGELGSRWGGRGYGSNGDEWIDLPPPNGDRSAPRRADTPGLALLHVVSREAVGRSGEGTPYCLDRPTVGLVVPEGGPCVEFVLASPGGS